VKAHKTIRPRRKIRKGIRCTAESQVPSGVMTASLVSLTPVLRARIGGSLIALPTGLRELRFWGGHPGFEYRLLLEDDSINGASSGLSVCCVSRSAAWRFYVAERTPIAGWLGLVALTLKSLAVKISLDACGRAFGRSPAPCGRVYVPNVSRCPSWFNAARAARHVHLPTRATFRFSRCLPRSKGSVPPRNLPQL
jgi:hypothetical protein